MTPTILHMGITALQAGSTVEGIRLIRIALKGTGTQGSGLPAQLRAIAYLWLAEAHTDDPAARRQYLALAVQADPTNTDARARLAADIAPASPPPPAPQTTSQTVAAVPPPAYVPAAPPQVYTPPPAQAASAPVAPGQVNVADYVARIIGGPAGVGTGIFVAEGIIATTRHITGSTERLMAEVYGVPQMPALVVRAFPELDLAFLRVEHRVPGMLPITPLPRVPDDAVLTAVSYAGDMIEGQQRPTRRALAAHWIPTTLTRLPDAGGDPIFDDQLYLVGLMTDNTSRTSDHRYGLHITAIRRALETWLAEARERRAYCPTCGASSRAGAAGLHYCETCGGVMPAARSAVRVPQTGTELYYPRGAMCAACRGEIGFYGGHCLRCGAAKR